MKSRVACAILAAGASQRLGEPKQLLLHRGRPLVRWAAECAWQSRAAACAVVVGAHRDAVRRALGDLSVSLITNPAWEEGMASSVRAASTWADSVGCDALLIALCDQPRLRFQHLDRLIAEYERSSSLVASRYAEKNAVPALFPRAYFSALAALHGGHGASALLNASGVVATVPWPEGELDVDTKANAEALLTSEAYRLPERAHADQHVCSQEDSDQKCAHH
jgi:molybdenum cofactor cytidylyltransferase